MKESISELWAILSTYLTMSSNMFVNSDFQGDGNIVGEVEVDHQQNELIHWHQVVGRNQQNV